MRDRWISNKDSEFRVNGQAWAKVLLDDPARFEIEPEIAQRFAESMERFGSLFARASHGKAGRGGTTEKDQARNQAIQALREIGNRVRNNPRVDAASKLLIGIEPRAKQSKAIACPQEPPLIWFKRAMHEGAGATPVHELKFQAASSTRMKPLGAVNLHLWIGYIGLDEEVPTHPAHHGGGISWMHGHFPHSPMLVQPNIPRMPMFVVYWGRWAGSAACDYGPFSKTIVAPMVGGMQRFQGPEFDAKRREQSKLEDVRAHRDVTVRIEVLEMQRATLLASVELPDPKQLEGPQEQAA